MSISWAVRLTWSTTTALPGPGDTTTRDLAAQPIFPQSIAHPAWDAYLEGREQLEGVLDEIQKNAEQLSVRSHVTYRVDTILLTNVFASVQRLSLCGHGVFSHSALIFALGEHACRIEELTLSDIQWRLHQKELIAALTANTSLRKITLDSVERSVCNAVAHGAANNTTIEIIRVFDTFIPETTLPVFLASPSLRILHLKRLSENEFFEPAGSFGWHDAPYGARARALLAANPLLQNPLRYKERTHAIIKDAWPRARFSKVNSDIDVCATRAPFPREYSLAGHDDLPYSVRRRVYAVWECLGDVLPHGVVVDILTQLCRQLTPKSCDSYVVP
jgi:hypothetical protein